FYRPLLPTLFPYTTLFRSETPSIIFQTILLVVPCNERFTLSLSGRLNVIVFPSIFTSIILLNSLNSSPLGPFTVTVLQEKLTSTPSGSSICLSSIRDFNFTSVLTLLLPNISEYFSTNCLLTCFFIRQNTIGC